MNQYIATKTAIYSQEHIRTRVYEAKNDEVAFKKTDEELYNASVYALEPGMIFLYRLEHVPYKLFYCTHCDGHMFSTLVDFDGSPHDHCPEGNGLWVKHKK